jgi:hypothetical protein
LSKVTVAMREVLPPAGTCRTIRVEGAGMYNVVTQGERNGAGNLLSTASAVGRPLRDRYRAICCRRDA